MPRQGIAMIKRSVLGVVILALFTFGIYPIIWYVSIGREMRREGADVPTAWLMIVPIANIYWLWKWSCGVEYVTGKELSGAGAFLLLFLLNVIGMAIVQSALNEAVDRRQVRLPMAVAM